MKILQIIDSLNTGGAEKLILDTIPIYRKKGIEMDVLVLQDDNYPFMQQLEKLNICKIYKLGSGSVYNPLHIFKIAKIIKDYDIAHIHLFPAQYWASFANILTRNKVKLIFTEHNTTNNRMGNALLSGLDKINYKLYHKIICITPEIQDILISYTGFTKTRLPVIENGINTQVYRNASPYNKQDIDNKIKESDVILMQVAGFRKQKDQRTLISSLQYLPNNYKVVLVGDGPLRTDLEKHTQEENLENRVIFLGKRNDVPRLLKTADFVVLSSKYEGLSLSSIEGMASGKPFIASNVSGLKEIVENYGILFPLSDAKTLANEILKLSGDSLYYEKIVDRCKKRALQFDIHKMVEKHIQLYEQITD